MTQINTINSVRGELRKNSSLKAKKSMQRFFKDEIKMLGLHYPQVKKISKKYYREIKDWDKKEFLLLCEELLKNGYHEEKLISFNWAFYYRENYSKEDFKIFERWLNEYVTDWALCDLFVPKTMNYFITKYPSLIKETKKWAKSNNKLVRRASAVCYFTDGAGIRPTSHNLSDIFDVAMKLIHDNEDLVQKGCGWLLKNASKRSQKEVFDFVMKHKNDMSRTALRYAIELMPERLKNKAMKKN